jgi:hypothetical protein
MKPVNLCRCCPAWGRLLQSMLPITDQQYYAFVPATFNLGHEGIPHDRRHHLTQMAIRLQSLTVFGRDEILPPFAFPTDALA